MVRGALAEISSRSHEATTGSPSRPRSAVTTVSGIITASGKASAGPENGRNHHRKAMTYRGEIIPADRRSSLHKLMHFTDEACLINSRKDAPASGSGESIQAQIAPGRKNPSSAIHTK